MSVLSEPQFIRQRFSRASAQYGAFADIQTVIAKSLVSELGILEERRVLDVGAGDGLTTRNLVGAGANVTALDAAWGMVCLGGKNCPKADWIQADAGALPFGSQRFDVVFSSSAYQWVDGLPDAFGEARRVLVPGGRFFVAMFGRATLEELFLSIDKAGQWSGRSLPEFKRLADARDVELALTSAGFKGFSLTVDNRAAEFDDVHSILQWLKGIGANALAKKFFWGKAFLAAVEREYRLNFSNNGKLKASFQVIWIEAKA